MLSATEATIKELEARIKRLEAVIQMQGPAAAPPTSVTLKCQGIIKIDTDLLILPGGSAPISRVGDQAAGGSNAMSIVGPGNQRVLG